MKHQHANRITCHVNSNHDNICAMVAQERPDDDDILDLTQHLSQHLLKYFKHSRNADILQEVTSMLPCKDYCTINDSSKQKWCGSVNMSEIKYI